MPTKAQEKYKIGEIDESISKIFDIKKRLGKGAYGIVWKALDKRSNETRAVKKIFDAFRDETDAQRTFREIVFLKALRNHPNIVKLHNVYRAANNLDIYLIFEYMESDLHNIIRKGNILKDIHKRYVMYQLLNAIKYIHSGNVIHRDLKPSNVLINSKCRCKLADFGLARSLAQHNVSSTGGGGDNNDMGNGEPLELLLTDYVATRWYRAPEILVASKKYTKGIDMWSVGCILAEMIRGRPIFQGSSTINQIERIVYTLPDITEHDVRAIGGGFGTALLNKRILKEKKTTLNEILSGASSDALDLIKSLLVLDPLGRLTANQALDHCYVQKFRNSIPELELNVNILPPFPDDVRLTVSEYRSKLYEIVQSHGEKNKTVEANKNPVKTREHHKSLQNNQEKSELKKMPKSKQNPSNTSLDEKNNMGFKAKQQQQTNTNLLAFLNKAVKKTPTPTTVKSKLYKNAKSSTTIPDARHSDEKYHSKDLHRSISHWNHQYQSTQYKHYAPLDRCSSNELHCDRQYTTGIDGRKRPTVIKKLHRSANALNKAEGGINEKNYSVPQRQQYTPPPVLKNFIRPSKSEIIPLNITKAQERFCYERRLKKLEEDIERYKNDIKNFCCEKYKYSPTPSQQQDISRPQTQQQSQQQPQQQPQQQHQQHNHHQEYLIANKSYNYKTTPKKISSSTSTPIKNIYYQLLTKGQHHDYYKSELDLSGNSGNGSSSDHIRNSYNLKSCSGLNKNSPKFQSDKIAAHQHHHLQQQQQQDHVTQKHRTEQPRCRPISKFV